MVVPFVIVVVIPIVVGSVFVLVGAERRGQSGHGDHKQSSEKREIADAELRYFHTEKSSNCAARKVLGAG